MSREGGEVAEAVRWQRVMGDEARDMGLGGVARGQRAAGECDVVCGEWGVAVGAWSRRAGAFVLFDRDADG